MTQDEDILGLTLDTFQAIVSRDMPRGVRPFAGGDETLLPLVLGLLRLAQEATTFDVPLSSIAHAAIRATREPQGGESLAEKG